MKLFLRATLLLPMLMTLCALNLAAQDTKVPLSYYLPDEVYNEKITTPEEYFGYNVGQWHLTPAQVVGYVRLLASESDRFQITTYAHSYEDRPLVQATISTPGNLAKIEEIRSNHLALADPSKSGSISIDEQPVVIWMGYSVHGNEPSGTNASVLFAYYLAASNNAETLAMMDKAIVLMDPIINPDGATRFAAHVNSFRGIQDVSDPNTFELNEPWPGGRTNHYWFDLNRDWLLQQHPESKGRIKRFHHWLPNVLTDHHEMGSNSSFFFMPGIPSRTHPLTPEKNQLLTGILGNYHAKQLDAIGSLYYTQESFDDFYYGKGSTYPDIFGGIGILFEQGSSRGHIRDTENGVIAFPFTVRNQVMTSFSTLKGSVENRKEILSYFRDFYNMMNKEAKDSQVQAYVIGDAADQTRTHALLDVLKRHGIKLKTVTQTLEVNGQLFEAGKSYAALISENHPRLLKVAFEERTTFTDSTFYDVSAWSLQHAYNIPVEMVDKKMLKQLKLGDEVQEITKFGGNIVRVNNSTPVGFVFSWDEFDAAQVLLDLQEQGLIMKVATSPFVLETAEGALEFDEGSIFIPFASQKMDKADFLAILKSSISNTNVTMYEAKTGLTSSGIDLGSRSFENYNHKNIALVVGDGVSSYEAGEVWHLFDQKLSHGITLLPSSDLARTDLSVYQTLIMVNGGYSRDQNIQDAVNEFVRGGGTIVATKRALTWLNAAKLASLKSVSYEDAPVPDFPAYNTSSLYSGAQVTGGTIFNAKLDITHPIGYGFKRDEIAIFRNHNDVYELHENKFGSPLRYTSNSLLAGYVSEENSKRINNSAAINVYSKGSGKVICFVDNPNFRAYWWGTNRLFINAVLFGDLISSATTR
jgi:hypothetical protein